MHVPTGRTSHFVGGELMGKPELLKIVQYRGETGFYLFYCGADGREITDTLHVSIQKAQEQAEWEFGVKPGEWMMDGD